MEALHNLLLSTEYQVQYYFVPNALKLCSIWKETIGPPNLQCTTEYITRVNKDFG